jgi:flavin reductase (DIM6/NTAB) family NADH-FMN oxidoreductase RutF
VFLVAPLVVVGSKEPDGSYDLAPKHMAYPLGWNNYYGFVCSPRHSTYENVRREGAFTVSFPRPSAVLESSLAASPRSDGTKPIVALLAHHPATHVDGILLDDSYLRLECRLHSVVDGFDANSLIVGSVVAATADGAYLREAERDPGEQIQEAPLLAYISPGRFATIRDTRQFPLPTGFSR